MTHFDLASSPSPRRSLRTGAALIASLALLAAPAAARADEPAPAPAPVAGVAAEPPAPALPEPPVTFRSVIVIHEDGSAPASDVPTRPRNMKLVWGGLGMGAAGVALLVGGLALAASDPPQSQPAFSYKACAQGALYLASPAVAEGCALAGLGQGLSGIGRGVGIGLAVGGGAVIAGGVAMAVVGGWQVPLRTPTRAEQAKGVPAVAVSPQRATLTWTF
jgi:hypothetical protein